MKAIVNKVKGMFLILICACLLSGMSVYAQGDKNTLNSDSIPDYNVWMAQTMINGHENAGNGLYPMFQSFKEPVYKELGGYLLDDAPLVSMSTAWSVFFNSEYRNQFANEQKYIYEVILMEYLKYDSESSSVSGELSNNSMQFSMMLYSILAKDLGENTNHYIKDMTVEEAVALYEKAETINGLNEAISKVKNSADNVTQLIQMLSEYQALQQVKEERIYLLKNAKEACEKSGASNKDFIKAAEELLQTVESSPLEYAKGKSLDVLWGQFCDNAWGTLCDKNPILKAIELTVSGLDVCFDSTNKASNNLKLALLYTTDCYMQQGMMKATEDFLASKTAENGKAFNACFRAYAQFQIYGNDFANTWLESYLNSGLATNAFNAIFFRENIETAKQMLDFSKSQADTRRRLLETVDKYGDIYKNIYGSDQWEELLETKVPVTGVRFKNSEVTLKNRNDIFVVYADIAPHNATNQNITYTSSNPSVLEVPKNGGFATIKGSGTATVTAKTEDGGFTATQKVTVGNGTSLTETDGGKCGDNVWWKLFDNGTLYIYGEGEMDSRRTWHVDFGAAVPWDDERNEIKKVIVTEGVTNIGCCAFWECNNLTSIELPEGITKIKTNAFSRCDSLISIELPDGLKEIESSVFSECDSLTNIGLPESIKRVSVAAFRFCDSLTSIELPDGLMEIEAMAFEYCDSLASIELPESIRKIGDNAFRQCDSLTSIKLPKSITKIGKWAFSECDSLTSIELPESVAWIGERAFSGCDDLKTIVFRGDVPVIEYAAFEQVVATAYYPPNLTWTSDVIQDIQDKQYHEGIIVWQLIGSSESESGGEGEGSDTDENGGSTETKPTPPTKPVAKVDIKNASVKFSATSYTYSGTAQKPTVTVTLQGKTLRNGTDYTVAYSNNINVGTAKVVITGKGDYAGSVTKTFAIIKKNQSISASNITKTVGNKPFYIGARRTVGNGALSYTSSNPKVATIASNGKVTLKRTGTTNITIRAGATSTYNAASKTIRLTVKPRKVSSIKLSAPSTKIAAGKKVKLTAKVSPSYASNKSLKWKSSNKKVAKVDSKGNVTFSKKAGGKKVTITAYAKDGSGKKKSYKFTVMKGSVKKVSISGAKSVKAGKSLRLKAKVSASKGANKKIKWKSSNTKYAKVSSSGKVTTYKKGRRKKVKITAYAVDGSNKKKTVTIKIK